MIVLLDWAQRPVLVQLVLPDHTTIGFESLDRAAALVVSQMVTFLGLAVLLLVVFFTAFLAGFFAEPAFFAALSFFADFLAFVAMDFFLLAFLTTFDLFTMAFA